MLFIHVKIFIDAQEQWYVDKCVFFLRLLFCKIYYLRLNVFRVPEGFALTILWRPPLSLVT